MVTGGWWTGARRGTWQSIRLAGLDVDNPEREVRFSFLDA